jgi:hypothetical protein
LLRRSKTETLIHTGRCIIANAISTFYQTLVTAATQASEALVGTNSLMDSVFMDYKPQVADLGQTLNVNVPNIVTAQVTDAGTSDIALTDVAVTSIPIVFNKHPYYGFVVRDYEQYNTPSNLRMTFLDAAIKGISENIDGNIASLCTSANFNVNAVITATGGYPTVPQFLAGYSNLADQRVPVTDTANMSFVNTPHSYARILGDSGWTSNLIAGAQLAQEAHVRGDVTTSFGSTIRMDQQLNFALTTGTSPNQTYTSILMHRWAMAVVTRPLPQPDANVVDYTYIDIKGIPVRVMLGYNLYPKLGYVITVDAGYGLAVTRPALGQIFSISQ